MIEPRQYQRECIDQTEEGFKHYQRQLVVMPTGAGKTIFFAHVAQRTLPGKTLILAHREELVDQAIDKIAKATGIFAQKEKADHKATLLAEVVVASVQTMARRLDKWPKDHFKRVIPDEAHHAISDQWQTVLQHFDAQVLGVTATPDRGDKKNLGEYFENIAFEISLFDLIKQGFLSPIKVKALPVQIDLSTVKSVAGDYDAKGLGDALEPYLRSIARALREHAGFRKTLVFLPLIATSKKFAAICNEEGLNAAHVDGESEDRKEILARYATGEFDVLCNAMLLTEGFDDPTIDCVAVLRPTRSRPLYSQMIGRGTRTHPTKDDLLVLDFLWLHEKHNLVRPAHLVAPSEEVADLITEQLVAQAGGGSQEELDLEELNTAALNEREQRLRAELEKQKRKTAKTVDAMEYCLSLHNVALAEYEPSCKWEMGPPTGPQLAALDRWEIDTSSITNAGQASKLLDTLATRKAHGLASPRQLRWLKQRNYPRAELVTKAEFGRILSQIKQRKNT